MKTPMQEMLEWVRATLPMDLDTSIMIEEKIESMFEKEKEFIMNIYTAGESDATHKIDSALNYYNQTFNTTSLDLTEWSNTKEK